MKKTQPNKHTIELGQRKRKLVRGIDRRIEKSSEPMAIHSALFFWFESTLLSSRQCLFIFSYIKERFHYFNIKKCCEGYPLLHGGIEMVITMPPNGTNTLSHFAFPQHFLKISFPFCTPIFWNESKKKRPLLFKGLKRFYILSEARRA